MPCFAAGMDTPPEHHVRYARAWALHQDENNSEETLRTLENEMDSAQDLFGWDEFQEFKKGLPGFIEYWDRMVPGLIKTSEA